VGGERYYISLGDEQRECARASLSVHMGVIRLLKERRSLRERTFTRFVHSAKSHCGEPYRMTTRPILGESNSKRQTFVHGFRLFATFTVRHRPSTLTRTETC
jgi:hypothetical protein